MRSTWLQRGGADDLIVVFGGWALGAAPFAALTGLQDVLFVEDWRELGTLPDLSGYARRSLLAFSFGVGAVGHWIADYGDPFDRKIAVNGTLAPADANHGIPPEMVEATAAGLSEASFARFCRRAGMDGAPQIDIAERQAELRAVIQRGRAPDVRFDRIWLSKRDRIMPPAAMEAAWANQQERVEWTDAPHMPFADRPTWEAWL